MTEIVFPACCARCRTCRVPPPLPTCCCALSRWLGASPGGCPSGRCGTIDRRIAVGTLVFPVAWLVFTLVRGAAIGFWRHPFRGAGDLGSGVVLSV